MYDLYPHSHSFIHGKDQLVSLLYCQCYLSILSQSVLCNWIFKYLSETEPSGHIGQSNNPPGVCIVLFLSIKWVLNNFSIHITYSKKEFILYLFCQTCFPFWLLKRWGRAAWEWLTAKVALQKTDNLCPQCFLGSL